MAEIKLFISCHKNYYVPNIDFFFPIQVGAALSPEQFPGMQRDDEGTDQISLKNRSYCELTAQYWAWKNETADYFGFFHYRRYLDFSGDFKRVYRLFRYPSDSVLTKLGYKDERIFQTIYGADIIVPIPEKMYITVYDHYKNSLFHYQKDLDLVIKIVRQYSPDFVPAMEQYFYSDKMYFGNIFIMRQKLFYDYCEWLFAILEEYDKIKNTDGYSSQELRVDGYLAERLLGVYIIYQKNCGKKCVEIPRAHFECMEGDLKKYCKKKIVNTLLPPGTKRRYKVKRITKNIMGFLK